MMIFLLINMFSNFISFLFLFFSNFIFISYLFYLNPKLLRREKERRSQPVLPLTGEVEFLFQIKNRWRRCNIEHPMA